MGFSRFTLLLIVSLTSKIIFGQAEISGYVNLPADWHNEIYLSVIYDYREMTDIQNSQIIATTTVDSTGYFEFPENLFVDNELIYRLHLTTDREEVEVYLVDFSEGGIGFNHVVFQAKKGDSVVVEKSKDDLFGKVVSQNDAVGLWRLMNEKEFDYRATTANLGTDEEGHFVLKHHNEMLASAKAKGDVAGVMLAFFLLKEDVNLSESYKEAYRINRDYFYGVLEGLEVSHPFYANRLKKELAVIDLQVDGDELVKVKKENTILYGVTIVLGVFLFLLLIWVKRLKREKPAVDLTKQELKIQELILKGLSNKEIASELFISLSTVKTHINALYKKQGVASRKELIEKKSTGV
jgi:DNA-binding CsgD family transcriptional regulator